MEYYVKPALCCASGIFGNTANTAPLAPLAMIGHFLQKLFI